MAEARRVTAYLLREVSGLTFTEIGDFFSKDHSFALYIIKKVDDQMQNDTMFKESIIAVLVSLTG